MIDSSIAIKIPRSLKLRIPQEKQKEQLISISVDSDFSEIAGIICTEG